ncbi:hypothetical protein CEXT_81291 [Caerostris extrusa]|uniref:Uncharacterized protein n=1 Tax=Caerostris extrusa TaxID=172846 RepID=A0AAV4VPR3_CAEEX|nr:hypothetical protein CEXT_81291 [Caerostris extrusa]
MAIIPYLATMTRKQTILHGSERKMGRCCFVPPMQHNIMLICSCSFCCFMPLGCGWSFVDEETFNSPVPGESMALSSWFYSIYGADVFKNLESS